MTIERPVRSADTASADFLDISSRLTEDERALQDTVRRFVREQVLPDVGSWFAEGVFPRSLVPELGKLGLLGMALDAPEYGCAAGSAVDYGLACLELEAGDSGLRSFVSVQGSLVMFPLWGYGSDEQRERWLPALAAGEAIGCFGLTEPDVGSDPAAMRTRARRDGSDWVLDGVKRWITNGAIADVAIVWAHTDEGIRGFVVPTDTPGFEAVEVPPKMSLRASVTSELVLTGVRLPEDAVLPGVVGLRGPLSCLDEARFGIVWGAAGAARACYESARDYALTREQFGQSIAGFQLTQSKLVEMLVGSQQAALLALHLGQLKDEGRLEPAQVSFGKLTNVRAALSIARQARSVLGANGITTDYPPLRHAMNLESVATYEGTEEIHTLTLGRAVTGVSAFR